MKIKHYKCKCGENDFFFGDRGNQYGIYCSYCGRWLKWADKDEQNLIMKQKPFMNKACVSSKVCEHDKEVVLDKIRTEIEKYRDSMPWENKSIIQWEAINYILEQIIDKYRERSEE